MKFAKIAVPLLIAFGAYVCGKSAELPAPGSSFVVGGLGSFEMANVRPLAESDRVIVRDGHFYVGSGGKETPEKRIRFFGVNLALSANFPSPEDADKLSRRLASLGVNIVRLHAIDQPAGQDPKRPNGVLVDAQRIDFDPVAIRFLDQLIEKLNRNGIYVDLNLHVNHSFPATEEGEYIPPQSKPVHVFDRRMIDWQKAYVTKLAERLRLSERPGLALVEISNESTLLDNWQENRLAKLVRGRFYSELAQEWGAYKQEHPEVDGEMVLPLGRFGLTDQQARQAAKFFISLDKRYIEEMSSAVRAAVGNDVAISGTQIIHSGRWKHGGFANFDINESASYMDAHFYVDHYYFPRRQWNWKDWLISNNWIGDNLVDTVSNAAFARYAGKPFVISEFNQPWPNDKGSGMLPVVTQFAASQDWDGLILYTYAHDRDWDNLTPSDFSLKGDWTKLIQFQQCAMYFRNIFPDVALPKTVLEIGRDARIDGAVKNISGELLKYLVNSRGILPTLALHNKIEMTGDAYHDLAYKTPSTSSSYINFDKSRRQIIFGSSRAAGFSGYLDDGDIAYSSIMTLIRDPGDSGFITAFLTSRDGLPLDRSRHMLLTLPGATYGSRNGQPITLQKISPISQWWTIPSNDGDYPSGNLYHVDPPVWMERISMLFKIKLSAKNVMIHSLDEYGRRVHSSTATVANGELILHANESDGLASPAFEIEVVN